MKNIKKQIVAFLVMGLIAGQVAPTPAPNADAAGKVKISRTATTLYPGDSEQLILLNTTKKQDKKVTWKSSKKTIVKVTKKGRITAVKSGSAKVTAKLGKKSYTCKVTVKKVLVATPKPSAATEGNQMFQSDVTNDMTTAAYWYNKVSDPTKVLLKRDKLDSVNALTMKADGAVMYDLKNRDINYNSNSSKSSLLSELDNVRGEGRIGSRTEIYRDGEKLDTAAMDAWFAEMKANVEAAASSDNDTRKYGVVTKRADIWMAPTNVYVGFSAGDTDSEFVNTSANINEPILVGITTKDGKYAHVLTDNCSGWIETEKFAVCDSKEEWLAQVYPADENSLVVDSSHLVLEESYTSPKTSKVDLYLGTILPLVGKSDIPAQIEERYPWSSYTVYLPTRAADGKLEKTLALIPVHHDVSIGYLDLTVKNILETAFKCLGDRYGWGGMLGAMDCSLYMRNIYRCFGLTLPRNTSAQIKMPTTRYDLTEMSTAQKEAIYDKLTPGSMLMFPGSHIMMYLGKIDGKYYVISDLGSLFDVGSETKTSVYSVAINSLDVKRGNGKTWTESMTWAVVPWEF